MEWGSSIGSSNEVHVRGDSEIQKGLLLQETTGGILECTHKHKQLFSPSRYLFLIVFLIFITELWSEKWPLEIILILLQQKKKSQIIAEQIRFMP